MYWHQLTDIPFTNEQVHYPMSLLIEWAQQFGRCYQELDPAPTLHCLSYAVEDATHPTHLLYTH